MPISAGTKPGRYEIRSNICDRGMGEVNLTEDAKLDRKVEYSLAPAISPDGKLIACKYLNARTLTTKVARIPFEGGEPLNNFRFIAACRRWRDMGFSVYVAGVHTRSSATGRRVR